MEINKITNTKNKIKESLKQLLKEKCLHEITISELINKSSVSRSTFYSHYKSIDDIIHQLIDNVFIHISSLNLEKEEEHDFSSTSIFSYKHIITHLFCHFDEEKELLLPIIKDSNINTINYINQKIETLVTNLYDNSLIKKNHIPKNVYIKILSNSLYTLIIESLNNPTIIKEEYTNYFFNLYGN